MANWRADAMQIRVDVDAHGLSVRVEDNGHGVPEEDLGKLGLHHHTSKIQSVQDLEAGPRTLGRVLQPQESPSFAVHPTTFPLACL